MHDIIVIRTHRFSEVERVLAGQLSKVFGADNVVFCVDESRGMVNTSPWRKSSLTRERAETLLGTSVPEDWGWRMGDLCHIAVHQDFEPHDYQWLIESDVHIPEGRETEILATLRALDGDFLACALRPKKLKSIALAVELVLPTAEWGCIFALNRLKSSRVPPLLELRREIHQRLHAQHKKNLKVPNDEAVLANLGASSDWQMVDLFEAAPQHFQQKWFDTNPPFLRRGLAELENSLQISHPVLELDQLFRRLESPQAEGHLQKYKAQRLRRILPALTEEERARVEAALQRSGSDVI